MWQQYQQEKNNITLTDDFKQNLIQTMNHVQAQNKRRRFRRNALALALSLLGIILIILGYLELTTTEQPSYTPCDPIISESTNHHIDPLCQKQRINIQNLEQLPPTQNNPTHGTLTTCEQQLSAFHTDDFTLSQTTYTFTNHHQQIQITQTTTRSTLTYNSLLNGTPMGLYRYDDQYLATFTNEGTTYQVVITGMEEEEFITYLQEFLNFLKNK